jgi:hypothetical protein
MRSLRAAGRTLVLLGVIGASVAVGWHIHRRYESDMRRAYAAIERSASETVETSIGTVEYCTRGDGVPVLVSHGIVGGFDQAIQTGESLLETDAQLVGVSRFGYLGSELPEEATPENQARAYVEVLDRADYRSASPEGRHRVDALLDTLVPVEPRKPGILNDERVTNTAIYHCIVDGSRLARDECARRYGSE